MSTANPMEGKLRLASIKLGGSTGALTLLVFSVSVLYLFAPMLFSGHAPVFRDAGHFYAPLWEWGRAEWASGRVPLWNPYQNLGVPHLAENTSSVFYPGKLLFALPGPFQFWYSVFLAAHVLLAGFAMYRLVRGWRLSPSAAGIASVSYALGGSILFQYCNPPMLIGAAWLPFAIGAAMRLLKKPGIERAVPLAAILAVMILGGDVQSVYHVGLMLLLGIVSQWCAWRKPESSRHAGRIAPDASPVRERGVSPWWWLHSLVWIGITFVVTIGFAAVQILPTRQHTAHSQRAAFAAPRSVDEALVRMVRGQPISASGLLATPTVGSAGSAHRQQTFDFSIGPWRWAETLWPNVFGRSFPVNARWIQTCAAEGRTWSPSLYAGLIPMWLAVSAVRYRRRLPMEARWIVVCTLLAILGSLGTYGIGWLINDWYQYHPDSGPAPVGRGFGGLYWLMTVVCPWYVRFRYPAKLWTIAACGGSILAAYEWDRSWQGRAGQQREEGTRRLPDDQARLRWLVRLGLLGLLGLAPAFVWRVPLQNTWASCQSVDSVFGPLNVHVAWKDLVGSLAHTSLLALAVTVLLSWHRVSASKWNSRLVILIVSIDLVVAHRWMLPSVPTSQLSRPFAVAADTRSIDPVRIYRSAPPNFRPSRWAKRSSADRFQQLVQWDRGTLFPQYQVLVRQGLIPSPTTIPDRDWQAFFQAWRTGLRESGKDVSESSGAVDSSDRLLAALGLTHQMTPRGQRSSAATRRQEPSIPNVSTSASLAARSLVDLEDGSEWVTVDRMARRSNQSRRVWAVPEIHCVAPLTTPSPQQVIDRTRQVLYDGSRIRDFYETAVVETDDDHFSGRAASVPHAIGTVPTAAQCVLTEYAPQQVLVDVVTQGPCLVVLCDQYHQDWHAELLREDATDATSWTPVPIYRTNRVMRGVWLDQAGAYTIRYRFRSLAFTTGALASATLWLTALGVWCFGSVRASRWYGAFRASHTPGPST